MSKTNKQIFIKNGSMKNSETFIEFSKLATLSTDKLQKDSIEDIQCIELEHLEQNTGRLINTVSSLGLNSDKNLFTSEDILYSKLRPYLNKYHLPNFNGSCSSEILVIRPKINREYLYYSLQSSRFKAISNLTYGSKMPRISWKEIGEYKVRVYDENINNKIGLYLSQIDNLICCHRKRVTKVKSLKYALSQVMFCINNVDTRRVYFDDQETLQLSYLENFLEISIEKNNNNVYKKEQVLSVTKNNGLQNQIEYLGRSYAGLDLSKYRVIHTGQICYTKSPLKSSPFGIIKVNTNISGIVSTLYAVYSVRDNCIANYIDYYFSNDLRLDKLLKPLLTKGAKNTMNISDSALLKGKVMFPKKSEQIKVTKFLSSMDKLIEIEEQKLNKLELMKKYYLQQIFS